MDHAGTITVPDQGQFVEVRQRCYVVSEVVKSNVPPATLPGDLLMGEDSFDDVTEQGKPIKAGDKIIIREAGQEKIVEVTGLIKKQGHYWVGYEANQHFYPWPLARLAKGDE
jgi:hypothetical protein